MISKELLSEVLGYEVLSYNGIHHDYILDDVTHIGYPLNIYELAHKCKEWAYDNNKLLSTWKTRHGEYICAFDREVDGTYDEIHEADTEPEAIFKACEWILEQKGQQ